MAEKDNNKRIINQICKRRQCILPNAFHYTTTYVPSLDFWFGRVKKKHRHIVIEAKHGVVYLLR